MTNDTPYIVDSLDALIPDALFSPARDQVVVGVHITPVYGKVELGLLASVVDEANARGFTLARETPFREEWLLCVFEAFDDEDDD